jgi:hypothetical protein
MTRRTLLAAARIDEDKLKEAGANSYVDFLEDCAQKSLSFEGMAPAPETG